ncbi:cleavage and polyadenylation specificity factor subunit 2 [Lineolata rhizophorae]|uniref:Cleavage and polyadenylation specificity factor subunit 2 n=1 Tax=Lineolata rhizophorae TaxID=578093 RepID=A0A6A6P050_9PEZI|nr:cleavage and polyadenylation specificity factor subunit 2 [Lineolata rhizophorae]
MFNFTPLLGARSTSPASQSLLELDGGVKILIDVGWDDSFDGDKLEELEKHIPTLSLVLLTHATKAHLGAFAHCCKHFPLFTRIPIYATNPVISLGRTLLQDIYASTPLASTVIPTSALSESTYSLPSVPDKGNPNILLQPPTYEEIAGYFSLINPLKYSQPHQPLGSPFSPPLNGLSISAYSAGHTLGGTIWHIQHGLESIVYAVDWNQAKEHVLSGAAWLGGAGGGAEVIEQLRRPTALVCSTKGAERVAIAGGRKKRDDMLLGMVRDTIANGGTVLIPSDSSARILELAYLLEDAWEKETGNIAENGSLKSARLFLASRTCGLTMRYARSMLEWMDSGIVKELESAGAEITARGGRRQGREFGRRGDNDEDLNLSNVPFDFKHIKLLERRSQVTRAIASSGPKVILASDTSLEWGFSREVIGQLANNSRNLIILTDRIAATPRNSPLNKGLGELLWQLWEERKAAATNGGQSDGVDPARTIDSQGLEAALDTAKAEPLTGNEVALYQQYLARQRQLQNTLQPDTNANLEASADAVDDRSSTTSESSEETDVEHQGKALKITATLSHQRHKLGLSDAELGINILLRRKNVHDFDVRGKKGREKMYPFVAKRRRADEFGELIRPEEYLRAEEREEQAEKEERIGKGQKKEIAVGQKRKWDDSGAVGGRRLSNGASGKRRRTGDITDGERFMSRGADGDEGAESSEDEEEVANQGPSKLVFTTETLRLNFKVGFVDFSGLHDKRSLQMLIPLIRPRKLILVGGGEGETLSLASDCRRLLGSGDSAEGGIDVFTPTIGQVVNASVDTSAWTVKLSKSLVKRLHWQNVRGLGVVAITGRLEGMPATPIDEVENAKKKIKTANGNEASADIGGGADPNAEPAIAAVPVLDVVPSSMAGATRSVAQPLHVGDLRLADLRKIMQASGFSAEFRGEGTLLISGSVAVRKTGTGKIEVESSDLGLGGGGAGGTPASKISEGTFYAVKRKIYEGLAVVAGG